MKTANNSKMGEDFFKYLPSEIVVNILSRLPTRAAMACKCVCKPWLSLLVTPEFVNSHISRSVPGIAVETHSKSYEIIEFMDELDLNFDEEHRWNVAFNFELPFDEPMHSSANALIFLSGVDHDDLILCNPITRDYIKLPCPRQPPQKIRLAWRLMDLDFDSSLRLYEDVGVVYLNGKLHWLVEKRTKPFVTCVLRDCLCVSDLSIDDSIVIWLMNEDEQCWTKKFIIPEFDPLDDFLHVWPLRVFENGDIFMESDDGKLFYYSNKLKTFDYDIVVREDHDTYLPTTIYASSFVSLKSFVMENVSSF
ncbi:uncharacterized protein LOC121741644 [Salvia splendens]|uniref:uncharacterized protein LOC121741644 n=1 Tax=Salvia splendens TaxID=180675 RepID=UPI001C256FAF|nr:uncharacterized protein LOC121741644 [Salvia splendens]